MHVFPNAWSYCINATATVVRVEYCPRTKEEWNNAAIKKDCGRLVGGKGCITAKKFTYHCVINQYQTETVEVCARGRFIFGSSIYNS